MVIGLIIAVLVAVVAAVLLAAETYLQVRTLERMNTSRQAAILAELGSFRSETQRASTLTAYRLARIERTLDITPLEGMPLEPMRQNGGART